MTTKAPEKKNSSRKIVKIILWTLLILLPVYILPLILVLSGGYHDLMAAIVVRPMAEKYIEETYPGEDLYVERAYFGFKSGAYYADIASRTSRDTHFDLCYDLGWPDLVNDTYFYVTDGSTTFWRLEDEYGALVQSAANADNLNGIYGSFCMYDEDAANSSFFSPDGLNPAELTLDMEGDMNELGAKHGVIDCNFAVEAEEVTAERALELLTQLDSSLTSAGVRYRFIDFDLWARNEDGSVDHDAGTISLSRISPDAIASGDIPGLLR